jgi:soluble lytic murein transglycosylase-like protein
MKVRYFMHYLSLLGRKPTVILRGQLSNWKHLVLSIGLLLGGATVMGSAQADVWGYVDAKGVAHFAADKVDDRYELYFKGGQSFDTKDGLPNATPAAPATAAALTKPGSATDEMSRPMGLPKLAPKLVAFFEISPSFKAVKHHLREASNTHKIDFELLQALIATESGFDTMAVSPKGAVGLMQLMPPTAQRYGVQADAKSSIEKKLTDPKINIRAGSRYLRDLIAMFPGKPELALAAYNAGEGAVKRYGNKIPPFAETQNYVKTVMQIYTTLKPPTLTAAAAKPLDTKTPARVRVEIGGALNRGNMVPPLVGAPQPHTSALPATGAP